MTRGPIVEASPTNIERAAQLVRSGQIVACPTETRYGLAADALNHEAVERLLTVKGRAEVNPIAVIVADLAMLERVARAPSGLAAELAARHWPGPLTLILPALPDLPAALTSSTNGVGVRISPDPVTAQLVRAAGCPLTATSANRSGEPPAGSASEAAELDVALTLDDGLRDGVPSTVAMVDSMGAVKVLRQGAVTL